MSQIGAGKVAQKRLPNVPNRKNIMFSPTAKIVSNGYGILSGHGPGTEQTENLSRGPNTQKRSKRQSNSLLNIKTSELLSSSTGPTFPTVDRIDDFTGPSFGLSSGLPLHPQTSQASPSTSVRAKKTAVAVNQRTTKSSLLLERVADADAGNGEDLFQFGKNFVLGLGPETKILDIPFDKVGTLCGVAPTISFIPDNKAMLRQILQIFIHYMRQIQNFHNLRRRQDECLAWKKYFFLPTVLFDNNRQGKVKDVIHNRICKSLMQT